MNGLVAPYHWRVPNDVVERLEVVTRDRCSRLRRRGCGRGDGGFVIGFESKIVKKLSRWWPGWLKVPGFVEVRVVVGFDNSGSKIKVTDVLVHCGVSEEDAGKVVAVQFTCPCTRLFDANSGTKNFESRQVRL
jgi:hypothetical protein